MIVAGGGTGSVTVFMGEQLNHTNGEIVHLDLSAASMHIAQTRAKIRGLRNIIWIQNWIEGVRFLGMGSFEELQCSGVLHHIKFLTMNSSITPSSRTRAMSLPLRKPPRPGSHFS